MPYRRPISAIRRLLTTEAAGGYVLMASAALAMLVANSPFSADYLQVQQFEIAGMSLLHWINDGLMALVFLLVGLEMKRELIAGEMATWSQRLLPGAAALGGMIVPALVYTAVNAATPENRIGWAIPAATDIAFALGVLALLGRRVPAPLKLLLTAIAIIDDLGAIVIIALAYTAQIEFASLGLAVAGLALLLGLNRCGIRSLYPYFIIGGLVWYAVLQSGVHATVAGVAVAFTIPLGNGPHDAKASLLRLEHALAPLVAFAIIPIFSFANAGVDIRGLSVVALAQPVPLGVALGLVIGKQIGVFGAIAALVRSRAVDMPAGASWRQLWGLSLLCGIGFTMSLFIAGLAFGTGSAQEGAAKIGILGGSIIAAVGGYLVLSRTAPRR